MLESAIYSSAGNPELAIRLVRQGSDDVARRGMAWNYAMMIYWNQPTESRRFLDAAGFDEAAKQDFEENMQRQIMYR